jgi:hypothetical protein
MAKGTKINAETYVKTLKRFKQRMNCVCQGKEPMLLQHNNARPHTSAVTLAAIASDLKLFHTLPTAWIWHSMTSGCLQPLGNISNEFISHVMKQLKLLWENDFENS